jgi:hypothetical protein
MLNVECSLFQCFSFSALKLIPLSPIPLSEGPVLCAFCAFGRPGFLFSMAGQTDSIAGKAGNGENI